MASRSVNMVPCIGVHDKEFLRSAGISEWEWMQQRFILVQESFSSVTWRRSRTFEACRSDPKKEMASEQ